MKYFTKNIFFSSFFHLRLLKMILRGKMCVLMKYTHVLLQRKKVLICYIPR